jgi:hypothetical protein
MTTLAKPDLSKLSANVDGHRRDRLSHAIQAADRQLIAMRVERVAANHFIFQRRILPDP